jgi:hypothetical protein
MSTIIYGDVHGCFDKFQTLRKELNITQDDRERQKLSQIYFTILTYKKGSKMKTNKLTITAIVSIMILSGCTSTTGVSCTQTIPNSISKVGCEKPFIVGQTTKTEVEEKLGSTLFIYEKPNGVTKLVYLYAEDVSLGKRAFLGVKGLRINLELWFDKNGVLIKKKYNNDANYHHPEMMETYNNIIKNGPENAKGGNGSFVSPVGAIQNLLK